MQGDDTDNLSIEDQLFKVMAMVEAKDITLDFAYSKFADLAIMAKNVPSSREFNSINGEHEIWQNLTKIYEETYTERFGADEYQRVKKT